MIVKPLKWLVIAKHHKEKEILAAFEMYAQAEEYADKYEDAEILMNQVRILYDEKWSKQ